MSLDRSSIYLITSLEGLSLWFSTKEHENMRMITGHLNVLKLVVSMNSWSFVSRNKFLNKKLFQQCGKV